MENIASIEISQKDLYGITLIDFHNQLLEIGRVNGAETMRIEKAHRNDTSRYAHGEYYASYDMCRSNGTERQNLTKALWNEHFGKYVKSFSYVRFR